MSEQRDDFDGPRGSAERLLSPAAYAELQRLARTYLDGRPPGQTLQPTALVHEAYLKLVPGAASSWNEPRHLIAALARAMRQVLVNRTLAKRTRKRDEPGQRVELDDALSFYEGSSIDLLVLHEALEKLGGLDPRQAEIVDLRFFGGLTVEEVGGVLGLSARTVEREWRAARAWLRTELEGS